MKKKALLVFFVVILFAGITQSAWTAETFVAHIDWNGLEGDPDECTLVVKTLQNFQSGALDIVEMIYQGEAGGLSLKLHLM